MMMSSNSRSSFRFSPLYFNVSRMLRALYLLSLGNRGWKGSLKKLCRVEPPALMAAMPVGANTTCFFFVLAAMYLRKVDLPVPAFPVRKSERRVNCMIWSAFCSSLFSRSICSISFVMVVREAFVCEGNGYRSSKLMWCSCTCTPSSSSSISMGTSMGFPFSSNMISSSSNKLSFNNESLGS